MPRANPGDRGGNPRDLCGRECIRNCGDARLVDHLAIGADRARKTLAGELACGGTPSGVGAE